MTQSDEIGRAAARGAVWLGIAQSLKIAVGFIGTVILARILLPSDFGVVAMAAPLVAFAMIVQNLGLSQALIQAENASNAQINSLFWYNILAAIVLSGLIVLLAPLIAHFYGDVRIGWLAAAYASQISISALATVQIALLNRNMRFGSLSIIETAGLLCGFAATIGFALLLRNYWSLFLGGLTATLVVCGLAWRFGKWKPGAPDLREGRDLLGFGAHVVGSNIMNFIGQNADNVSIGRMWGAASLGLYDRSYQLMSAPVRALNDPLSRIMIPALSRLRGQPEQYRSAYLTAINGVAILTMPLAATVAICSKEVIALVLGPSWSEAAPIFFWLSLAAITTPIANSSGWLYISSGRAKSMFRWQIGYLVIILLAIALGISGGAIGVAFALCIARFGSMPAVFYLASRSTPVSQFDLYRSLSPGLAGGAVAFLAATEIPVAGLFKIVFVGAVALVSSVLVQMILPEGRAAMFRLLRMARDLLHKRQDSLPLQG